MAVSPDPEDAIHVDNAPPQPDPTRAPSPAASDDENETDDAPTADLMVTSRPRRANAGNRMSILLAKAAEEEGICEGDEEWGDDWKEAANEEDFVGGDVNEQDDYNLHSSSSSSDEDEGDDDDDAGEKELQKAERQERVKKRKAGGALNPLQASLARVAARKRVRLDLDAPLPGVESAAPRPKKKSERASWIPTAEDGPIRMSARKQTVANKEHTMSKLKEKDRRREDTLAMMKAAEARKAKDEPKAMTQAERLAEAARVERVNSKSLHRWEEEELLRAAERQAKIDALKNRQIEGPFVRYWSGPAIWVDDKLKYTGKDAPTVEELDERLNTELSAEQGAEKAAATQPSGPAPSTPAPNSQYPHPQLPQGIPAPNGYPGQPKHQPPPTPQPNSATPQGQPAPSHTQPPQSPHIPPSTNETAYPQGGNTGYPSTIIFPPPPEMNSCLSDIEHYANGQPPHPQSQPPLTPQPPQTPHAQPNTPYSHFPPNPWSQIPHPPFPHPSLSDPSLANHTTPPQALQHFQHPPPPPPPPRRRLIRKALRNLLILANFPHLTVPSTTSAPARSRTATTKEKDRAALIQLSTTLFAWSPTDAATFVNSVLSAPKTSKKEKGADKGAVKREVCVVTNKVARYRDPGTGIPYHDQKAFGVLRGVVVGEFVWSPALGCYVGGRPGGVGRVPGKGVEPVKGVPRRFWDPGYVPPPPKPKDAAAAGPGAGLGVPPQAPAGPASTATSQTPVAGGPAAVGNGSDPPTAVATEKAAGPRVGS